MEQHPRIELGFQVYETCTSPFMFMLHKLASYKEYSLTSLISECVLTLHRNLSKMAESRGADPQRFYSSACFQDMFRALTDLLSIYFSLKYKNDLINAVLKSLYPSVIILYCSGVRLY